MRSAWVHTFLKRFARLAWSLRHVIELEGQGIGFHNFIESVDTTTPGGKLVFHIFGALAEFEARDRHRN